MTSSRIREDGCLDYVNTRIQYYANVQFEVRGIALRMRGILFSILLVIFYENTRQRGYFSASCTVCALVTVAQTQGYFTGSFHALSS